MIKNVFPLDTTSSGGEDDGSHSENVVDEGEDHNLSFKNRETDSITSSRINDSVKDEKVPRKSGTDYDVLMELGKGDKK